MRLKVAVASTRSPTGVEQDSQVAAPAPAPCCPGRALSVSSEDVSPHVLWPGLLGDCLCVGKHWLWAQLSTYQEGWPRFGQLRTALFNDCDSY